MSTPAKFLFLGGTRDGERLPVQQPGQALPASVELPLGPKPPKGTRGPRPTEIYQIMRFSGETDSFFLYALKGISGNSALRALIECYQSKPSTMETDNVKHPSSSCPHIPGGR